MKKIGSSGILLQCPFWTLCFYVHPSSDPGIGPDETYQGWVDDGLVRDLWDLSRACLGRLALGHTWVWPKDRITSMLYYGTSVSNKLVSSV